MYDIKLGQGCGIKATMLTPTGEACDLRRARYIAASLVLPSGATMNCQDVSFNEVTNAVYVRLLGTRELTATGQYGIVFNIKLEDKTMYSTPVVWFAEVKQDAPTGYHELTLSLSLTVVNFPDNVSYTGASPKIGDKNTWLIYDDKLNAYVDTGIEVGYANLLSRYDGKFAEIEAAEEQHEHSEEIRKSSELLRETNEQNRIGAEIDRARDEQKRISSERSRVLAEKDRVTSEQIRTNEDRKRELVEALRVQAEEGRVTAEIERNKRANEAAAGADDSAKKADAATKAVMQLPVVRTDMEQTLDAAGRERARRNISAVGALPVALTLGADNALTVASPLNTLTAHYRLYAARPGAYRWSVVISDASGAQIEEAEAEVISAEDVLHLAFRPAVLDQRYDLALSLAADAVTAASAEPWLRNRQEGAQTSEGQFITNDPGLNKYDGDRGLEAYFKTGSDITTRQYVVLNQPIGLAVESGRLYVNMWGVYGPSWIIAPDSEYHVVVVFDKAKLEASLYVNDKFALSQVRSDVPPAYSAYNNIGGGGSNGLLFKGLVYHVRLFSYAPSLADIALFYNNGNPAGYVVPGEMRGGGNSYKSDFTAGPDDWAASNEDMTVAWSSGCLTASSTSTDVNIYRTFTKAATAFRMPHAYAFEVVIEGSPQFSQMLFFPFSWRDSAAFVQSDAEIIDGGIRLSGHVATGLFSPTCYCYFHGVPVGTVIRIKSIRVTPLNCIAEYLPQNVTPAVWYDSAKQMPVNGELPPLWGPAGGYDLAANGSPRIVIKSAPENAEAVAEVLAQSESSLAARIARLERALVSLTSGRTYIPKLTVRELEVWGANNLILTGEGAPTKSPDRAGQIYIDTVSGAVYKSTGNAAVSDWKNA